LNLFEFNNYLGTVQDISPRVFRWLVNNNLHSIHDDNEIFCFGIFTLFFPCQGYFERLGKES